MHGTEFKTNGGKSQMQDQEHTESLRDIDLVDILWPLLAHGRFISIGTFAIGLTTACITFLMPPTFTARTSFLPPQQQQSNANTALSSLGNLAGLAGAAGANLRTPADQFVALMQSMTVTDRLIDEFKLIEVYKVEKRWNARKVLQSKVQMTVGKKDGLITVEVDDSNPQLAADIANRYVDELRRFTSLLALTEAQQRRIFFEQLISQTKLKLTQAQQALLGSGYSEGTLKAEPKAAAEGYAKLRAELTSAEVRLQALRSQLLDKTPEVEQQSAVVSTLRGKLSLLEGKGGATPGPDYISKYRDFKYQETLLELFSRQYEMARVDESREGAVIQVVDPAQPPERKSKPVRTLIALGAMAVGFAMLAGWVLARAAWLRYATRPANAEKLAALRGGRR